MNPAWPTQEMWVEGGIGLGPKPPRLTLSLWGPTDDLLSDNLDLMSRVLLFLSFPVAPEFLVDSFAVSYFYILIYILALDCTTHFSFTTLSQICCLVTLLLSSMVLWVTTHQRLVKVLCVKPQGLCDIRHVFLLCEVCVLVSLGWSDEMHESRYGLLSTSRASFLVREVRPLGGLLLSRSPT